MADFRKWILFAVCFVLAALGAYAQTSDVTAPAPEPQPVYWVAAGAGWSHYAPVATQGLLWVNLGTRVTENNYILATLDMTSANASTRVGVGRVLVRKKRWGLLALGEFGAATGASILGIPTTVATDGTHLQPELSGSVVPAFGTGGVLTYNLPWGDGLHFVLACRVIKTGISDGPLNLVKPIFQVGFGKAF